MIAFYDTNLVLIQATLSGLVLALAIQVPLRMGVFSFAGAGSYGIGAYLSAILVLRQGMPGPVAIAVAVLVAAVIGLLLGLLIFKLNGLYLAMATVAFDLIISVIAINGGDLTGASTGLYGVLTDFTTGQMFALTVLVVGLVALSERGRMRRRVDAVRDDPELAASLGINVRRYRLVAFVVSGALGGLAGGMNVMVRTAIGPLDIGFGLIVLALTMIVVGGSRSWKGAVIGAVIFTWLPDVLAVIGEWQELVYGVIVAVAAVFLPRGLYGVIVDLTKWLGRIRRKRRTGGAEQPVDAPESVEPERVELDNTLSREQGGEVARMAAQSEVS
ncbi:branched-chain amino acid transport system permease protein [Kribbella sp. VKM Ac-2527]|uniref:Branched-chain amino acid transport system permease protein n=1 Tax=Kribbella caucasensis TaxID=2512215 RepID=A0A4R6KEA2_9ACTN|nr:branched-chain amino acid ABC transporter permease [Kribbella sp. VKM Ac-2527]TDO48692.1 branched-chain amino acid transport system permease protein [Kribbella sp. VKM Ac-2527]